MRLRRRTRADRIFVVHNNQIHGITHKQETHRFSTIFVCAVSEEVVGWQEDENDDDAHESSLECRVHPRLSPPGSSSCPAPLLDLADLRGPTDRTRTAARRPSPLAVSLTLLSLPLPSIQFALFVALLLPFPPPRWLPSCPRRRRPPPFISTTWDTRSVQTDRKAEGPERSRRDGTGRSPDSDRLVVMCVSG